MRIDELQPIHPRKRAKHVGRGGKKGTYSGKGIKGQKARAGARLKPIIRELLKRYPKRRGTRLRKRENVHAIVHTGLLNEAFAAHEIVNSRTLLAKQLIGRIQGKIPKIKILQGGAIDHPLVIQNCALSKTARETIEKARGAIR